MPDKELSERTTPPENGEEWSKIYRAVDRANKLWVIGGPIHAAVSNWKAWLAVLGVLAFINGSEAIQILRDLWGMKP